MCGSQLRSSFLRIWLASVVGICGGVPNGTDNEKGVLLGDVVISTSIAQYDFGHRLPNRFIRKDTLADDLDYGKHAKHVGWAPVG